MKKLFAAFVVALSLVGVFAAVAPSASATVPPTYLDVNWQISPTLCVHVWGSSGSYLGQAYTDGTAQTWNCNPFAPVNYNFGQNLVMQTTLVRWPGGFPYQLCGSGWNTGPYNGDGSKVHGARSGNCGMNSGDGYEGNFEVHVILCLFGGCSTYIEAWDTPVWHV